MDAIYQNLLTALIRTRPVSSDIPAVNAAVDILESFLRERGLFCSVETLDGRKILYAASSPEKFQKILFNAHLDVVPVESEDEWKTEIRDGKFFGRGSGDCLGHAVLLAQILSERKNDSSLGAIFSTDEEIGGDTTLAMIHRGYGASLVALVVDSWDNGNIVCAQKGILVVRLTAHGRGGHASTPWCFDNPIDRLLDGYTALRAAWDHPSTENQWKNSLAPCVLRAGNAHNQIPNSAEMVLNIRYTDDDQRDEILHRIRSLTDLTATLEMESAPLSASTNAPILELLREASRKTLGRLPEFTRMNAATDARHLKTLGIPVAMIGVEHAFIHAPGEFLVLRSYDDYHTILTDFIQSVNTSSSSSS